jgi:hypothetical protein
MNKRLAWSLTSVLPLLLLGYWEQKSLTVRRPVVAKVANLASAKQPQKVEAAPPEDLGDLVTATGPLIVWTRDGQEHEAAAQAAVSHEAQSTSHGVGALAEKPANSLHEVFPISDRASFAFVIPPHQVNPKLHGHFRSFIKGIHSVSQSDKTAAVDLMVFNQQEFDDFVHGRPGGATYELDSAQNQTVDFVLPTTGDQPGAYHLVFLNPTRTPRMVEADFTASLD